MGSRMVAPPAPVYQLLSARESLRKRFSYIGLAGGPSNVERGAIDELAVSIRDLGMEFSGDELESAFRFYSIEKSANHAPCNRYGNIWAFDRTAVTAPGGQMPQAEEEELYLNANIVADGKGNWWAASQAPIPPTFNTYFHAILNRSATRRHDQLFPLEGSGASASSTKTKVAMIIQLTGWFDGKVPKADDYLPTAEKPRSFSGDGNSPKIKLALVDSKPGPQMTWSELRLWSGEDEGMTLHHFLFHAWPDHGVPNTKEDIEALKQLLDTTAILQREEMCEVYVNCSAGIGRTGTFIALWSLLNEPMRFVDPGPRTKPTSALKPFPDWAAGDKVAKTVDLLREQRGMMCQTNSQIELVYRMTGLSPAQP